MPWVNITTSQSLTPESRDAIAGELVETISEITGKPTAYIMVSVRQDHVRLGEDPAPAAVVDYRAIGGIDPEANVVLTQRFCATLETHAAVPSARTYVVFSDIPASCWGWNNKTFG